MTNRRRNPGSILIAVLVCIAVTSMILAGVASAALRQRRQVRHELQMEQTRWLLEAGIVYAAQRCREDEDYSGETLSVSPALIQSHDTTVTISVTDSGDGVKQLQVNAKLQGQSTTDTLTQRTKSVSIKPRP